MLKLRLDGMTYQRIADKAGISRQRVQQLLSPPTAVKRIVVARANSRCQECDIFVGQSGHCHHTGGKEENYNDIDNLQLLCVSCHRKAHSLMPDNVKEERIKMGFNPAEMALNQEVSEMTIRRWEHKQSK